MVFLAVGQGVSNMSLHNVLHSEPLILIIPKADSPAFVASDIIVSFWSTAVFRIILYHHPLFVPILNLQ